MHYWSILLAMAVTLASSSGAVEVRVSQSANDERSASPERAALLKRVISNQHRDDAAVDIYEHMEHRQARKGAQDPAIVQDQAFRVFPTGTGMDKISVQPDGRPADPVAYAEELRKLEKTLAAAATNPDTRAQRDALAKYNKKQKDRAELVDAARDAFIFTWLGHEIMGGQNLAKFHLDPNPKYKPTSRVTSIFSHIRATIWLDESAEQLARVDAEIFEDLAFGGGLVAKVYKGGHFILEQREAAPGIWFPTLYDYNFEGRKFLFTMGVHVRTTLKQYRRVGPPAEALGVIRAELNKMPGVLSDR